MRVVSSVLSIHSSDTAGVCSSLCELGGMTVVHDASGCNSTYATHDEPRWYDYRSRIYISALTEADVIMGNDERFISNVVTALRSMPGCRFAALCGSPLPMMVGTDFDALAMEIERETGVPVLALHTNGISSYLSGVNQALTAFGQRFCRSDAVKGKNKVNILGATPLDFSINGQIGSIRRWLTEEGFEVNSCWSMDSSFEELENAGAASVNLLVSSSAKVLAEYLEKRFGTPFVAAVPMGRRFARICAAALRNAADSGVSCAPCLTERSSGQAVGAVIGETLAASSLACALQLAQGTVLRVLDPLEEEFAFTVPGDLHVPDENAVCEAFSGADVIYADPLYQPAAPAGVRFVPMPHEAFSGRCFRKSMRDLCADNLEKEFGIC